MIFFKNLKLFLLFFSILFTFQLGNAHTLLISDIDDTIKQSHVLDAFEAVNQSVNTDIIFPGMAELYEKIQPLAQDSQVSTSLSYHYVSNAPAILMELNHYLLLSKAEFPQGGLHLRSGESRESFKFGKISELLKKYKPSTVILVGDNGERDPKIYDDIEKTFNTIKFFTYIRINYVPQKKDQLLRENQKGFVSAAEIANDLFNKQMFLKKDLNYMLEASLQVGESYFRGGEGDESSEKSKTLLGLKPWVDCSIHKPDLSPSPQTLNPAEYNSRWIENLKKNLLQNIIRRCRL